MVGIHSHKAVPLIRPSLGIVGAVDRDLVEVGTKTMAMGVIIGEQTTLGEGGEEVIKHIAGMSHWLCHTCTVCTTKIIVIQLCRCRYAIHVIGNVDQ